MSWLRTEIYCTLGRPRGTVVSCEMTKIPQRWWHFCTNNKAWKYFAKEEYFYFVIFCSYALCNVQPWMISSKYVIPLYNLQTRIYEVYQFLPFQQFRYIRHQLSTRSNSCLFYVKEKPSNLIVWHLLPILTCILTINYYTTTVYQDVNQPSSHLKEINYTFYVNLIFITRYNLK